MIVEPLTAHQPINREVVLPKARGGFCALLAKQRLSSLTLKTSLSLPLECDSPEFAGLYCKHATGSGVQPAEGGRHIKRQRSSGALLCSVLECCIAHSV
jgi:hypothetical protein